jgi:tetrahydromethanopterin S-methyltransferase subunit F
VEILDFEIENNGTQMASRKAKLSNGLLSERRNGFPTTVLYQALKWLFFKEE